ncbi:hypothetical protein C8J57DRAFT_1437127 [Mycena rebaudengoi]|nr:hypothetical protein C8J57DRAFT_1437127 [Mycena rebaudengoi]
MNITAGNARTVLNAPPEQMVDLLPRIFAKLLEPGQTDDFLHNYTAHAQIKLDTFGEIAFESGIAKTMMLVAQIERPGQQAGLAAYYGFESIWHMVRTANVSERRALVKELVEANVIEITLDKVETASLCIQRQGAVALLRSLSCESFLGEIITSKQAAEIFLAMSRYTLAGPSVFIDQMGTPSTTWQSILSFGNNSAPTFKAASYAPRFYAMSQENAIWTLHGLLCRSPPPSQEFSLEILQHSPEILDLLFECAKLAREPWYPETQVDSVAAEVLVLLFSPYLDTIPGVSVETDDAFQIKRNAEWKALVESFKILTSRPGWVEKLVSVWDRIDNEQRQRLRPMLAQASTKHFAQTPPSNETFLAIFEYRGTSRICMLRIIATLTHVADECNISDADLVSFLHIGFSATQPIKSMENSRSEQEMYVWIERNQELYRSPMDTVFTYQKVQEAPEQVPDESVMGPIAFYSDPHLLDAIPRWKKLPTGTSSAASLSKVKEVTTQVSIQRALSLAAPRVGEHREKGNKRMRVDNEIDYAGFAYCSAAELAAALVAFDTATASRHAQCIRGVRKQLVLCLGNAAEMALGLQKNGRALQFALAAGAATENLPETDAVDESVKTKNQRRVDRARGTV